MRQSSRGPKIAALLVASLISLPVRAGMAQSRSISLQGRWLTGNGSLCSLHPAPWPGPIAMLPQASFTISSCSDAEFDAHTLAPLVISVANSDTAAVDFRIPLLSEVTAQLGTRRASAFALYLPIPGNPGFAKKIEVGLQTTVRPEQTLELLYLVPKLPGRPVVVVAGFGRLSFPAR